MATKDLFIHSIRQVETDGVINIPTALHYKSEDDYVIGYDALSAAGDVLDINQDFKVDLGRHNSKAPKQNQKFPTAYGEFKSAYVMTYDFITKVLKNVNHWLNIHQVEEAAHVLIAEPLAMQEADDSGWLENYRRNLREILAGRTSSDFPNIHFKEVSFLPEPFAVFQYYRYGINHPLMSQAIKHQALIMDFGGGTFDVCVIETTNEGDISGSGRNSKPFGASSVPVGGFFVNRAIAEYLYRQHIFQSAKRDQFKQGLKLYEKWRRNEQDLASMRDDYQKFVLNFHRTSFELETLKIGLCKQVSDWGLESPLSAQTKVRLPSDPFADNSPSKSVPFSATEMRAIFLNEVWGKKLQPAVKLCLQRALDALDGEPITIVLLSGGSASIGWLQHALFNDFDGQLAQAQVLPLPDFQEVVSKGLAVECARRFYSDSGDFGSVVYNRLCLMLDVNRTDESSDCRPRPFNPVTSTLPNPGQPGVLLQSASAVRAFLGQPMRWKVGQLGAEPKKLDYYFLRSSLDPDDIENRLNFEETTAHAPSRCNFDKHLKLELTVREDGTAIPKFIYHSGRTEAEDVFTQGKPFALDVTCGASSPNAKAYIGFDFGTSNSSVSFVESSSVQEYKKRLGDSSWKELHELAYELPYPIADPLLSYLSETSTTNNERIIKSGRQTFEAMLTLNYFAALADYRWHRLKDHRRDKSKVFGSLSQRSAGPLWGMLRQLYVEQNFRNKATFTAALADCFEGEVYNSLDAFVNFVVNEKHDKSDSVDLHRPLRIAANLCNRLFSKVCFGFFENLRTDKFGKGVTGHFRVAHGQPPFIRDYHVKLTTLPPEIMPYLFYPEAGIALPLSPMVLWWQDAKAHMYNHGRCYLFDFAAKDGKSFSFKTVGVADQLTVTENHAELGALAKQLKDERTEDSEIEIIQVNLIDKK